MTQPLASDPLHGLDTIDWASLEHAYGSAADVPGLLRALLDPNPNTRGEAMYTLYGNIWHQGTIYPASAPAATFLLRLLDHPGTPDPAEVAGLLASLALGSSYLEVHAVDERGQATWREILASEGKVLEEELGTRPRICRGCCRARCPDPRARQPEARSRSAVAGRGS